MYVETESGPAFRHEALLYAGPEEFVRATAAFVRSGVQAEEPVLVVVGAEKIGWLRDELGCAADHVQFADMAEVGTNPARIIPAWQEFVGARAMDGLAVRGVGEPIWAERSAAELVECQRHESLLNLAFADAPGWWLLCPYDTALDPAVLDEARRSHPFVSEHGIATPSAGYVGLAVAERFGEPLPEPTSPPHEREFETGSLEALRTLVAREARAAGLAPTRVEYLVLAVNELATNSLRHGGGEGMLRIWSDDETLYCEIRDGGRIDDPLAGRARPGPTSEGGRGLWLVNQLCDLVQVRSSPGNVVRVHMHRS